MFVSGTGAEKLLDEGQALNWWTNTTGNPNKPSAVSYARRVEDRGAKAITVTVDNEYQSNRDRNNRNRFDCGYMQTGVPAAVPAGERRIPATAAMGLPHTPNPTSDYIGRLRGARPTPGVGESAPASRSGGPAAGWGRGPGRRARVTGIAEWTPSTRAS